MHEDFPSSPLAAEAQFLEAESALGAKRNYAAGELYAKYAEQRPLSSRVRDVEKHMYKIGLWLIEDGRRGLWGLGIFTTSEEGVSLLRRLATLLPTGEYADDALMRIGRWYAEDRDFVGAETTLEDLLKNYPSSEWVLEARFLLGWTYREDNRGPAYDGEKLRRARAEFLAFAAKASADPARAAEYADRIRAAREEVAAIDDDLARKALLRARFYERSGRPEAALAVLREGARSWGSTEHGRECGDRADALARDLGVEAPSGPSAPPPAEDGKQ